MKPADLRCALVELVSADHANVYRWWKVSVTGARESISDPAAAVTWLQAHGYRQAGAMLGQDRRLAVLWLKDNDQPEYLESALGERVVPATCAWSPTESKIVTTRTAAQIQHQRRRITARGDVDSRDLQFVELPTRAATLKLYGLS
jgi:hypothetical protein